MKILACLAIALPLLAQEGHPLVGSWHGTWGPNAKERTDITVIFNWDGKVISGMFNPGPDAAKFLAATLEPSTWTVHLEAEMKDRSGKLVKVVAEGKIEDVTNARRSISGTWVQGGVKAEFKIVRDN